MLESEKKRDYIVPAERIERMAVPDSEKPYSIPLNWCWLNLLDSFENKTDSTRKIKQKDYLTEGKYAIVDQGQALIGGYTNDEVMLFTGKTPIIIFGDHTRCIKYIDFPFAQGADGVKVLSPKDFFDAKAFYYALQSISIPNLGYRRHYPLFKNFYIPLPPMKEQQRIVERIESLFAKLDEAREKAQAVVDSFEGRKAAILHKAFTGKLSEEWRKSHPHKSWSTKPWGDFISTIEAGKNWKAEERPPKDNEFGIVKVSAVTWGHFNEYESKTCFDSSQWNPKTQIKEGDFLFSRANTIQLVGNCVIVDKITKRLMLSDKILRFIFDGSVNQPFVLYYTRSRLYRNQVEQLASGNQEGMRNISQNNVKRIQFPIPSIEEQNEIVKILDGYFSQVHEANEMAKNVIDQIETIKKSILARAFRGELGTNDPNDESALELLKKVLSVEATPQPRKKGVTLPKAFSGELKTELERKIMKLFIQRETDSLPIKDLMSVSSKPFDVLETLHDLEKRQIIKRAENNSTTYELMR